MAGEKGRRRSPCPGKGGRTHTAALLCLGKRAGRGLLARVRAGFKTSLAKGSARAGRTGLQGGGSERGNAAGAPRSNAVRPAAAEEEPAGLERGGRKEGLLAEKEKEEFMKQRRRGFTLVELIVVIAIIGILAAVLIPTFSGAIQSARQASDKSDVAHMNQELLIYKIQENVSSVDYHSALLWLTTNGYSLTSTADGYGYWFDEEEEKLIYANVEEVISGAASAAEEEFLDDPGRIGPTGWTLIDRRSDNPVIAAVNGIRSLVKEASASGNAVTEINARLSELFAEQLKKAEGNAAAYAYLEKFDPANTLYITESGVYSGNGETAGEGEGAASIKTAVVYADSLRVLDKAPSVTTETYTLAEGAVLELPKTVALVMNGSLSGITGTNVTVKADRAQFLEGSLNAAVAGASEIQTVSLDQILGNSSGAIDYQVTYTYKEAVIEYQQNGVTMTRTSRVKLTEAEKENLNGALTGQAADYGGGSEERVLREYLVPTFSFSGSFANVSGIDVQMKKDGNLVIFYGMTYGKNGTISQVVTFGYFTNVSVGYTDVTNDQNETQREYQYTASNPLRGYDFSKFYGALSVTAYAGATEVSLTLAPGDTLYRSGGEQPQTQTPDKFTVSSNGTVIYASYLEKEAAA